MFKRFYIPVSALLLALFLLATAGFSTGCGVYSFADVSIPDSIKTIRINFIDNKARYINPQLSPNLTERIKQKINNQTKLTRTNSDNAHYEISGYVSDYAVSTSGISDKVTQTNRLTVAVHIVVTNRLADKTDEYDVSRSFEFSANSSLQAAEASLLDEMVRGLTDDIFNRVFSNW
ncbi:LPS assembly lipoprotein LptE [Paraflavisolibacter sp. H34]|uniref:LPS assembly lipoprotein LptE n=1 Tax=Huijunlia imazamoxiresistens TaxID=3127457 RepID=UPI003019D030